MCTVTLIARRNGYALGMNRDEQLTRARASPPARHRLGRRDVLFPSEPGGGTWIGANDCGLTLALINWYAVPARVVSGALSRGQVILAALTADSPGGVQKVLTALALKSINPFRLIGVFPERGAVAEWRWDLQRLRQCNYPWRSGTWISSGYDEPGAQRERGKVYRAALRQHSAGGLDWLRRLHRSHLPERGPYSTCMHRADAATVSYTEVSVTRHVVTMTYHPDAPCCDAQELSLSLELTPARPESGHVFVPPKRNASQPINSRER